ncbi:MAG: hypothetical protein NT155_04305 [Candidatus Staskawiczbacteria bacterium]|nr:hypothetical protein [Candidatus Staskawiczbacteria bacterium]
MKITVTKKTDDPSVGEWKWTAKVDGRPEKSGGGRSSAEAIGELISRDLSVQQALGLEIVDKTPATTPRLCLAGALLLLPDEMHDDPPH